MTRESLRRPFFMQCYLTAPFAVAQQDTINDYVRAMVDGFADVDETLVGDIDRLGLAEEIEEDFDPFGGGGDRDDRTAGQGCAALRAQPARLGKGRAHGHGCTGKPRFSKPKKYATLLAGWKRRGGLEHENSFFRLSGRSTPLLNRRPH